MSDGGGKKRVVVVCPGRGSYTKESLGYLQNRQSSVVDDFLKDIDARRRDEGEPSISELDGAGKFVTAIHTKGEHASPLIYACSFSDFVELDRDKYEVVAITGNSMGWYSALSLAGCLDWEGSYHVIQTMGSMMREDCIGGQVIYPIVGSLWREVPGLRQRLECLLLELNQNPNYEVYISIRLGGYLVFAGNEAGLTALAKALKPIDHFPMRLVNHAAFHTPMLTEVTQRAYQQIPRALFRGPEIPLVDGRGKVWTPFSTDPDELYRYTFDHQVVQTYDFTSSLVVSLKEWAPDLVVLLGPGDSLGGAIGQIMVAINWKGIDSKRSFQDRQNTNPVLYSVGR